MLKNNRPKIDPCENPWFISVQWKTPVSESLFLIMLQASQCYHFFLNHCLPLFDRYNKIVLNIKIFTKFVSIFLASSLRKLV